MYIYIIYIDIDIYTHEHVSCVSFSVGEDISESGRRHKSSCGHRLQSVFTYGGGLIVKKSDDGRDWNIQKSYKGKNTTTTSHNNCIV